MLCKQTTITVLALLSGNAFNLMSMQNCSTPGSKTDAINNDVSCFFCDLEPQSVIKEALGSNQILDELSKHQCEFSTEDCDIPLDAIVAQDNATNLSFCTLEAINAIPNISKINKEKIESKSSLSDDNTHALDYKSYSSESFQKAQCDGNASENELLKLISLNKLATNNTSLQSIKINQKSTVWLSAAYQIYDKNINPFIRNRVILSVDGGGSRGYMSLNIISDIVNKYRNKINSLLGFSDLNLPMPLPIDLYAGTSIGAYVCLAVLLNKIKPTLDTFPSDFKKIFKAPNLCICMPKYNNNNREQVFRKLTKEKNEELTGEMLTKIYGVDFFSTYLSLPKGKQVSYHSKDFETQHKAIVDILMMTSAAPTIFPAYECENELAIDGGIGANNPALLAYLRDKQIKDTFQDIQSKKATKVSPLRMTYSGRCSQSVRKCNYNYSSDTTHNIRNDLQYKEQCTSHSTFDNEIDDNDQYAAKTAVISIGTGEPTKDYTKFYKLKNAGVVQWSLPYPDIVTHNSSDTMTDILKSYQDIKLFRIQTKLNHKLMATDQASKKAFKLLKAAASGVVSEKSQCINNVVDTMCLITIDRLLYIHYNATSGKQFTAAILDGNEINNEHKKYLKAIASVFIENNIYHLSLDNLDKVKSSILEIYQPKQQYKSTSRK